MLQALGGREPERVAGFLFLGTAGVELEERVRPALEDVIREW